LVDFYMEFWEAMYLYNRGLGHVYASDDGNYVEWTRILCTLSLLPILAAEFDVPPLLALVCFLRWLKLLYTLNGFMRFGPRILPIIATFRSSVSFCVVIFFFVVAFSHSGWALYVCEPIQQVYRLSLLGEYDLRHMVAENNVLHHLWFIACAFLMPVALLNVFIGVMTESYDRHQDQCHTTFLQHRANLNVRYFLQSSFAQEAGQKKKDEPTNARKIQQITFERSYLWVCHAGKDADDFTAALEGRMSMVKRHAEERTDRCLKSVDGMSGDVRRICKELQVLARKQVQLNNRLRLVLRDAEGGDGLPKEQTAGQNEEKGAAGGGLLRFSAISDVQGAALSAERPSRLSSLSTTNLTPPVAVSPNA